MSSPLPPQKPKSDSLREEISAQGRDKDHYSLDEMLHKLRDGDQEGEDKGELVTRSDGSTARRVKKRRRRSGQPKGVTTAEKDAKKRKSLIIKISVAVSLLALLAAGLLFLLISLNTDGFVQETEEQAAEWTGAEVKFSGLRTLPNNISANEVSFHWVEGYFTESLNLKKIKGYAALKSFLGQNMGGREIGASQGTLVLRTPVEGVKWIEPLAEENFPFDFQRYYCNRLNVIFGSSEQVKLSNTYTSLRYLKGGGWQVRLDEGLFSLKGWKPFPLEGGFVKFHENELELSAVRLGCPEELSSIYNTSISLSGRIPLKLGARATLDFETRNFPSNGLMGELLSQLFTGSIRVIEDSKISFVVGGEGIDQIEMPFNAEYLDVEKFPFLKDLHELFPDKGFGEVRFDKDIEGVFRWIPDGFGIQGLTMSDQDLLRVEGDILVDTEEKIRGGFRLYISRGLINSDPSLKSMPGFATQKSGYSIVDIKLGGTVKFPEDDFRQVTGLDASSFIPNSNQQPNLDSLFENLTQPIPDSNSSLKDHTQ